MDVVLDPIPILPPLVLQSLPNRNVPQWLPVIGCLVRMQTVNGLRRAPRNRHHTLDVVLSTIRKMKTADGLRDVLNFGMKTIAESQWMDLHKTDVNGWILIHILIAPN